MFSSIIDESENAQKNGVVMIVNTKVLCIALHVIGGTFSPSPTVASCCEITQCLLLFLFYSGEGRGQGLSRL